MVLKKAIKGYSNPDNKEVNYYYPTNDLVTGPDIIFFWVARMVMAGYAFNGQKPFNSVYFTGIVRDKLRRKMSKSLGNSPDPLELIEKYGADATRMGLLLSAPAGNDILYDESLIEQGRNFCNKIWNAYRLIAGWEVVDDSKVDATVLKSNQLANEWFKARLQTAVNDVHAAFKDYRLSEALMSVYKLVWDDFCSWYLEMVKPVYGEPINQSTMAEVKANFENILTLLQPFMPFISEELHHALYEGTPAKALIVTDFPKATEVVNPVDDKALAIIAEVRNLRNSKGLSPKVAFEVIVKTEQPANYQGWESIIQKLANVSGISYNAGKPEKCISSLIGTDEMYIPYAEMVDEAEEKKKIAEEIDYLKGFLKSVDAKLSNEKFVANAKPEVIEKERQKKADAEEKIQKLESGLA